MTALKIVPAIRQTPEEWFNERLKTGKRERFTETAVITPALAEIMLGHNEGNRRLRRTKITQHVRSLQNKTFILTHQGIAFSKEGVLNDGQHRLAAIMESGISAPMTVTFGCKREEFEVIDQGGLRTSADLIHIRGKTSPKVRASIAARVLSFNGENNKAFLAAQKVAQFEESLNHDLMEASCEFGLNGRKIAPPATLGLAYYWIASNTKQKPAKLPAFCEGLLTGAELPASNPILKVRNLLVERYDFGQKSGTQRMIKEAAAIVLAWNAWIEETKYLKGKWPHSTSLPEVA